MSDQKHLIKEALISLVQLHPAIWNMSHKDHSNRDVMYNDWNEIFNSLLEQFSEQDLDSAGIGNLEQMKAVWQNLRGSYHKIKAKGKHIPSGSGAADVPKSRWPYLKQISFIDYSDPILRSVSTLENECSQISEQGQHENEDNQNDILGSFIVSEEGELYTDYAELPDPSIPSETSPIRPQTSLCAQTSPVPPQTPSAPPQTSTTPPNTSAHSVPPPVPPHLTREQQWTVGKQRLPSRKKKKLEENSDQLFNNTQAAFNTTMEILARGEKAEKENSDEIFGKLIASRLSKITSQKKV